MAASARQSHDLLGGRGKARRRHVRTGRAPFRGWSEASHRHLRNRAGRPMTPAERAALLEEAGEHMADVLSTAIAASGLGCRQASRLLGRNMAPVIAKVNRGNPVLRFSSLIDLAAVAGFRLRLSLEGR